MKSLIVLLLAIFLLSCEKKEKLTVEFETVQRQGSVSAHSSSEKNAGVVKLRDTVVFSDSAEGAEVKLSVNTATRDSILECEVLGETGKASYRFVFNHKLKTAACTNYRYSEPIYINPEPQIVSEKTQTLSTSRTASKHLIDVFENYHSALKAETVKQN